MKQKVYELFTLSVSGCTPACFGIREYWQVASTIGKQFKENKRE